MTICPNGGSKGQAVSALLIEGKVAIFRLAYDDQQNLEAFAGQMCSDTCVAESSMAIPFENLLFIPSISDCWF